MTADAPDDIIRRLEAQPYAVELHRLSETTYTRDSPTLMKFLGLDPAGPLPNMRMVGTVWRCRIGRQRSWHYGRSLGAAASAALADRDKGDRS